MVGHGDLYAARAGDVLCAESTYQGGRRDKERRASVAVYFYYRRRVKKRACDHQQEVSAACGDNAGSEARNVRLHRHDIGHLDGGGAAADRLLTRVVGTGFDGHGIDIRAYPQRGGAFELYREVTRGTAA